ncbi:MAG: hypothetical protein ACI8QS_000221 [Planctomycetota bacterium]
MSTEEALRYIAGDDPRPLLVLRECLTCNGTDDALLTRKEDNERTMLLSRWFHCVKLAPAVIETDHPFHALFAGDSPAHLFVAQSGGQVRVELKGDQSRTELWGAMNGALALAYEKVTDKGPKGALGQLYKLLDKLDQVDEAILLVQRRLEDEAEDDGLNTRKARKLTAKLQELREERAEFRAEADKASALKLRKVEEADAVASGSSQKD